VGKESEPHDNCGLRIHDNLTLSIAWKMPLQSLEVINSIKSQLGPVDHVGATAALNPPKYTHPITP